uniref:Uncharacterized protein n=1 Tax=Arundo donax TaxID=35708 RepID=A0A0A9A5F2_ARUDO
MLKFNPAGLECWLYLIENEVIPGCPDYPAH